MRACILVVEDDEPFRYYLTHTLRMHGYGVVEAEDGAAGVQQWLAMEPKPDLVLSDISMPRMNGIEFGAKLRANDPDIRLLYVSADAKPEFDLLRKPFHGDDLMAAIRKRLSEPRARAPGA